jgi:hypothetical protein
MVPLRLQHLGSLGELSRLTEMRRLMLSFAGRRLIFAISTFVLHAVDNSQATFHAYVGDDLQSFSEWNLRCTLVKLSRGIVHGIHTDQPGIRGRHCHTASVHL